MLVIFFFFLVFNMDCPKKTVYDVVSSQARNMSPLGGDRAGGEENNKIPLKRDILLHTEMSSVVHTVCLPVSVHSPAACPKPTAGLSEDTQNNMWKIMERPDLGQ